MLLFNYSTIVDPILKDVRLCIVELSGVKAGDWVLDVACGSGDQVFHYAQKGAIATGVDENPHMIELAEKNWERRRYNRATFDIADADELPFPDGYFDCVSISLALHEMERSERNKSVSEMKRVVKRKGILIFVDFQSPLRRNFIGYFIRAIEFIAGKENHEHFRDYLAHGGLKGILKENQLVPQEEALVKSGNIQILKVKV